MRLMGMVLAAALLATPGCTTTSTGQKVPDVALMQSVAKSATFLGTSIYLNGLGDKTRFPAHPESREKFETARTSLRILIASGTFTAADLTAALQALPVKELQGAEGTMLVGEVVILWDAYGRQLASLDKAKVFDTYILPVAKAVLEGLDMALGPSL